MKKELKGPYRVFPPFIDAYSYNESKSSFEEFKEALINIAEDWGEKSIGLQILEFGSAFTFYDDTGNEKFVQAIGWFDTDENDNIKEQYVCYYEGDYKERLGEWKVVKGTWSWEMDVT